MLPQLGLKAKLLITYVTLILVCLFIAPIKLSQLHPYVANEIQLNDTEDTILKNFTTYQCFEPWTTFVVPFRNREQHLPLYLKAIKTHQIQQNKSNVSKNLV